MRRKTRSLTLLALFLAGSSFSQVVEEDPYTPPEEISPSYRVDAEEVYDSIRDLKRLRSREVSIDQVEKFAEEQSYGLQSLFHSGQVFLGWKELEGYLSDVLQKAIPRNKPSRIFPSTSTGWNARVFFDGTILVDIGFIADLQSEAELAFVLAHESAHFYEKDVVDGYFRNVDQKARRKRKRDYKVEQVASALEEASYSRRDEAKADSLGAVYVNEAGYDLSHGIRAFEKLKSYKELYQASEPEDEEEGDEDVPEAIKGLFSSHPELEERISELEHIRYKLKNEGDAFLVDKDRFESLRKKARHEMLELLLKRGEYEECMMRSFKYHLLSSGDPVFREYLVRSLRRGLFVEPAKGEKGFLHWVHQGSEKDSLSILDDLRYLIRDSSRFNALDIPTALKDSSMPFRTYEEAYKYYSRKALEDEEAYVYLGKAVQAHLNSEYANRDSFLNRYLRGEDTALADFARAFKKEEVFSGPPEKGDPLMLVSRLNFVEDRTYGFHRRFLQEDEKADAYIRSLKGLIQEEFPSNDLKVNYMPRYRKNEFRNAVRAQRIRDLLFKYPKKLIGAGIEEEEGGGVEKIVEEHLVKKRMKNDSILFMLAPEYWSFFKDEGVASLEYLFSFGFDDQVKGMKSYFDAINPWFYLSGIWRFHAAHLTGAGRYYHQVGHLRYVPWNRKKFSKHVEAAPYDLTKNNFLNSAYYAIGYSRWKED